MHMSTLCIQTITVTLLLLVHFTPSLISVMGKLDPDSQILHSAHPHPLKLNPTDHSIQPMLCAGCKSPANTSDDLIYSCYQCDFHLHLSCAKFHQLISHPSHLAHPLALVPVCTYTGGIFNCDACLRRGNGFSYHCDSCNFDLHVICASKPLTVDHYLHEHPLVLTFKNPYETKGFSCDICAKIGSKHWLYRCGVCEFDAHLHCATATLPPPLPQQTGDQFHVQPKPGRSNSGNPSTLQGNQSFSALADKPSNKIPNGTQTQQNFPTENGRLGNYYGSGMQPNASYLVTAGVGMQPQHGYPWTIGAGMQRHHSYPPIGGMQQPYNPLTGGGGIQPQQDYQGGGGMQQSSYPVTSGLLNAVVPGLAEGAAQQVGQNLMQGLIGGNGDGSSSVYVNLGSTYTDNQEYQG